MACGARTLLPRGAGGRQRIWTCNVADSLEVGHTDARVVLHPGLGRVRQHVGRHVTLKGDHIPYSALTPLCTASMRGLQKIPLGSVVLGCMA